MKEVVNNLYERYLEHNLPNNTDIGIERFSRKALAKEYADLLEKHYKP
jgi:hypothetical protein